MNWDQLYAERYASPLGELLAGRMDVREGAGHPDLKMARRIGRLVRLIESAQPDVLLQNRQLLEELLQGLSDHPHVGMKGVLPILTALERVMPGVLSHMAVLPREIEHLDACIETAALFEPRRMRRLVAYLSSAESGAL